MTTNEMESEVSNQLQKDPPNNIEVLADTNTEESLLTDSNSTVNNP